VCKLCVSVITVTLFNVVGMFPLNSVLYLDTDDVSGWRSTLSLSSD
jgi:hypothetical protein